MALERQHLSFWPHIQPTRAPELRVSATDFLPSVRGARAKVAQDGDATRRSDRLAAIRSCSADGLQ